MTKGMNVWIWILVGIVVLVVGPSLFILANAWCRCLWMAVTP